MKKLFPFVFKNEKITSRSFFAVLWCSTLTMMLAVILLFSTTFAWFNDAYYSSVTSVESARYELTVTPVTRKKSVPTRATSQASALYICPLVKGDEHCITVKATGNAKTGYCIVEAKNGDDTSRFYTVQIEKGDSITLKIRAASGTELKFFARWGECKIDEKKYGSFIEGNDESMIDIGATPFVEYLVEDGALLEDIAEHYKVKKEDILTFNDIEELTAGELIMIPNTTVDEPFTLEPSSSQNEAE